MLYTHYGAVLYYIIQPSNRQTKRREVGLLYTCRPPTHYSFVKYSLYIHTKFKPTLTYDKQTLNTIAVHVLYHAQFMLKPAHITLIKHKKIIHKKENEEVYILNTLYV